MPPLLWRFDGENACWLSLRREGPCKAPRRKWLQLVRARQMRLRIIPARRPRLFLLPSGSASGRGEQSARSRRGHSADADSISAGRRRERLVSVLEGFIGHARASATRAGLLREGFVAATEQSYPVRASAPGTGTPVNTGAPAGGWLRPLAAVPRARSSSQAEEGDRKGSAGHWLED